MPARCASGFKGTHIQPPDQAVVPPKTGSFSTTITLSPCQAAVTAADRPLAPEPITSTSHAMVCGITWFLEKQRSAQSTQPGYRIGGDQSAGKAGTMNRSP